MLLPIDDNETIGDLQDRFNEAFCFLQLQFYDNRHKWKETSDKSHYITPDRKLGDVRKNHNSGIYEIKSWYKTGRVEEEFRDLYGLYVQIFYLKNKEWVQTSAADDLTLGYLNELGEKELEKK
jgi:hypothetical protein